VTKFIIQARQLQSKMQQRAAEGKLLLGWGANATLKLHQQKNAKR